MATKTAPELQSQQATAAPLKVTLQMTLSLKRELEKMKYRSTSPEYLASYVWETPEFFAKQEELTQLEYARLSALPAYNHLREQGRMQMAREFSRV